MHSSAVFLQEVDIFALKFYMDRIVPINHSWHQKTRREDRIPVCSHFDTKPECDKQMDGQTDRFAVAYTALAKLALRSAVKIIDRRNFTQ